ncbi:MAG: hypothetical protein FWE20_12090 [Defluviitaleaceae bacterium]|nr:hypothetical protein [Defluviitaleaceae bacterium]
MSAGQEAGAAHKLKIRDKLLQILEHTMKTSLSATEHSVEEYIEMVNSRQALFDELAALKPQGSQELDESNGTSSEILEIDAEIKGIVEKIAAREEHHNNQVAGMMLDLKKGIKEIKNEKAINSAYVKDSYESGMIFKSRN